MCFSFCMVLIVIHSRENGVQQKYKKNRISPIFYTFGEVYRTHIEFQRMVIDDELILKLQNLAKLDLSEQEAVAMKQELAKVIDMFDAISAVDTSDVEPLIYLSDATDNMREDEAKASPPRTVLEDIAPLTHQHYVAVPRVIET